MKIRTKLFCAVAALLLIALVGGIYLSDSDMEEIPFSSEKWRETSNLSLRGKMVDDLLSCGLLIGKKRDEIVELLGEPTSSLEKAYFYEVDIGQDYLSDDWNYNLEIHFEGSVVTKVKLTD